MIGRKESTLCGLDCWFAGLSAKFSCVMKHREFHAADIDMPDHGTRLFRTLVIRATQGMAETFRLGIGISVEDQDMFHALSPIRSDLRKMRWASR